MTNLRLIMDGHNPGALNMGIDEAVLEGVIAGMSEPTLRLYGWNPATLTIGYFQGLSEEADLAACAGYGISCIRRVTGGGAVLHEHEVTYSLIAPVGFAGIPEAILDSYAFICQGILLGLQPLGIEAQFVPLNDIVAGGKKISGNAQTRRHGVILQHGTILLAVDVDKMFSVLKVADEKIKDKLIATVKERVTGLSNLLGREVGFVQTQMALREGFAEALGVNLVTGFLTAAERVRAEQLAADKYRSNGWNAKR